MALTDYTSFAAPQGQGFITDEDGNRVFYDATTGQWLTPQSGGGIRRNVNLEDGGLLRQGGTSDYYRSLGLLGEGNLNGRSVLEVDITQNPDLAPYVQNVDGRNFLDAEMWGQLRPQNSGGLGDFLQYMPVIMGAVGGGMAGAGLFDPYSLAAAEAAGAGTLATAAPAAYDAGLAGTVGSEALYGAPAAAGGAGGLTIPAEYGAGLETAYGSMSGAAPVVDLTAPGAVAGTTNYAPGVLSSGGTVANTAGMAAGAGAVGNALTQSTQGTTFGIPNNILQGLLTGAGGYLAADRAADTLQNIYNQQRADRQPALNAFNTALQNPDTWYQSAPAMGAADSVLRQLSMQGNPANNPGSLARAAAYNLGGYNNYLGNMGNLGLGGQATQAELGSRMASAQGGQYGALGAGLGAALPNPYEDYLRAVTDSVRNRTTWGGGNTYG